MASRGKTAKKGVRKTSGILSRFWMFIAHALGGAIRFVFRGAMPEMNAEEVKAPPVQFQAPRPVLKEIHENYGSALSGGSDETEVADLPKQEPIIVDKGPGRNDKISVQYMDGTIKRDVKYKSVEEDLQSGKCIIVNFA